MIYDDLVIDLGDPMRPEITRSADFHDWEFIPKPSLTELAEQLAGGDFGRIVYADEQAATELTLRRIAAKDDTETFSKITEEVQDG